MDNNHSTVFTKTEERFDDNSRSLWSVVAIVYKVTLGNVWFRGKVIVYQDGIEVEWEADRPARHLYDILLTTLKVYEKKCNEYLR